MEVTRKQIDDIKNILSNNISPTKLDGNPWAESLLVQEYLKNHQELPEQKSGFILLKTFAHFFKSLIPSTPPKRGNRLDTQWGQFGILAALYFGKIEFGLPAANTLRDAWGKIDESIAFFVNEKYEQISSPLDIEEYELLIDEIEITPTSTLSDWHVKGLEKFAKLIYSEEQQLSWDLKQPSSVLEENVFPPKREKKRLTVSSLSQLVPNFVNWNSKKGRITLISIAVLIVLFFGWRGWSSYSLFRDLYDRAESIQLAAETGLALDQPEQLLKLGEELSQTRETSTKFRKAIRPFTWLGKYLGWLPLIGSDLAASGPVVEMLESTLIAADESFKGLIPVMKERAENPGGNSTSDLIALLANQNEYFELANENIDYALSQRQQFNSEKLNVRIANIIENRFDPYFYLLLDGVKMLTYLPDIVGAMEEGPKTYLILVQNEDELRPTGGFITAVGAVVIENGEILSFNLEDSYAVDNFDIAYPVAPWQLNSYMDASILVLRDANWRPDFPIVAEQVERLYAYSRSHSVDGVIAINQQAIKRIIGAIGSIEIDGETIKSKDVIEFMRSARGIAPLSDGRDWWLTRKDFMRDMASAMLEKIQNSEDVDWLLLGKSLTKALDEKHILIQMDNAEISNILNRRGWDGNLRNSDNDYLSVIDTNIGFNKANVIIESQIIYTVNLRDLDQPSAHLDIEYVNNSQVSKSCVHGPDYGSGDYEYLINQCYWDYVRVYKQDGVELVDYLALDIPGNWLLSEIAIPARVDYIDEVNNFEEYGTLLVLPTKEQAELSFTFSLPSTVVVNEGNDSYRYILNVQKQAGVAFTPITISVVLPSGAEIRVNDADLWVQASDGSWLQQTLLVKDHEFVLYFDLPQ